MNGQKRVLWFTGLSGAGKSTIANLVEKYLHAQGRHTMSLDGDNVRHGLNRDLGFSEADRVENIRRVAEVSKLFVEAGLIVLVSFISPYRAERMLARDCVAEGEFLEIFVDTPVDECRRRDPKGLYRSADAGQIPQLHRRRCAVRVAARSGDQAADAECTHPRRWPSGLSKNCAGAASPPDALPDGAAEIRACRVCAAHLPLGPRPVFRASPTARLLIVGQAPGTKVHATGIPLNDPSGDRLRDWLRMDRDTFYDESRSRSCRWGSAIPVGCPTVATRRRGRSARRYGRIRCWR